MSIELVRTVFRTIDADRRLRRTPDRQGFERLYARRSDPWALAVSPMAQQRYLGIIDALTRYTPCETLLDIGCGEGHFTRYLGGMARRVVGIDVSPSALARAANHSPNIDFVCAGIEEYTTGEPFDVVTAVEVLYYVQPVHLALDRVLRLGRHVLVTYSKGHYAEIGPIVERHPRLLGLQFCPFFGTKRFGFTIAHLGGVVDEPP